LKPAPRALATQLWVLMHEGPQNKLVDLLHLAGSGRTSIPIDGDIDPALYRTAGYRVCGERGVRVDILERLADLIRPALAWREGAPGARPRGSFPGGGFTVVNTMTSLTGASGEDFASILRSLGYRMERRPKPLDPRPEPSVAPASAGATIQPQAHDGTAAGGTTALADIADARLQADPQPPETDTVATAKDDREPGADAVETGQEAVREREDAAQETPLQAVQEAAQESASEAAQEAAQEKAQETVSEAVQEAAQATSQDAAQETVAATDASAPAPSGEPETVEVWRPGRPEGRRRARERHRRPARQPRAEFGKHAPKARQESAMPAAAVVEATPPAAQGESASSPEERADTGRPSRHRHHQEHRSDRPPRERPPAKRLERREKAPDPNSPFAKLAALKAQLEADAKERR
jgi:ATP-dependent RNA helicase SUPV3L1/SUV3